MTTWQHEAIEEIDNILCIILKADKYQILANTLKVLLANAWESLKEAAIEEAFRDLENRKGDLSEDDIKQLLSSLEVKLGEPLSKACLQIVADHQAKAYKQAFKKIDGKTRNVEFSFNKTSTDALKWLKENETYWIGKFYSNQIAGKLDATLNEFAKGIFEQGLSRAEGGKLLRTACKDFFDKPEGFKGHITEYFEGLSDHITTRAREFGRVDAYDRAGIKYVKVEAVMDARTSQICQHMNGRIFPVSHLRERRDSIMAAESPEEAKQASPWLTDKQTLDLVAGKSMKEFLSGNITKKIAQPPYHWKCRTITVMATEEEYREQDRAENSHDFHEFSSEIFAKKWAENNIADKVTYPKFSEDSTTQLKMVNDVNRTIYDVNSKYGMGKLKEIIDYKNEINAFYSPRTDSVGINGNIVRFLADYKQPQMDFYKVGNELEAHSFYYTNNIEDVLVHELGHRLHFKNYADFDKLLSNSSNWENEFGITGRGRDSKSECVAENYSMYYHKEKYNIADIRINPDIISLIKSLEK